MKSSKNSSQDVIIRNINNYLKRHKIPIELDKKGVCHGLSILQIKYSLAGKDDEFSEMLELISKKTANLEDADANILIFIEKIRGLQAGRKGLDQTQSNCYEHEWVEHGAEGKKEVNNLKSLFNIGLNLEPEKWAGIFQKINLELDESMLVSSLEHTLSIQRIIHSGKIKYKVYDPNHKTMYEVFDDAEQMST